MKKIFVLLCLAVAFFVLSAESCESTSQSTSHESPREVALNAQNRMAEKAVEAVAIPEVSYFHEKRTIANWAKRWDKPNLPCYVYLVSYGTIIGYYVTDGKPASTRSYIMPEEKIIRDPYGSADAGGQLVSEPDIDGTYGENNPGIRFFTAEGTAVEWAGSGASYIYSDAPLPLKVPKLN